MPLLLRSANKEGRVPTVDLLCYSMALRSVSVPLTRTGFTALVLAHNFNGA